MTAFAPLFSPASRVALWVLVGVMATSLGARVLAAVVPQPMLIATAFTVFLGASFIVERISRNVALAAVAVTVGGGAWSFAAWCSFDDFAMTPPLLLAVAVVVLCVAVTRLLPRALVGQLQARLTPFSTALAVLMVFSWRFANKGVVGCAVALLFVVWAALWLVFEVNEIGAAGDDAGGIDDADVGAAARILSSITEIAWNFLVFWVRYTDDD